MGGLCGGGGSSRSRSRSSSSSSRSRSYASVDARQPRGSANLQNKNTAGQTFKMDLGLAPKNERYYADLPGRQERSRAAVDAALSNKSDDGPGLSSASSRASSRSAAMVSSPGSAPTPPPVPTDGSAPGAEESKVLEGAKTRKGRASTVRTEMQGLLTEAKARRRRSLMAGKGEGSSGLIS